jgi:PAS domain S-box-containing protein
MEPTIGVLYVHSAGVEGPLLGRLRGQDERLSVHRGQGPEDDSEPGVDCVLLDAPTGQHVERGVEAAHAAYGEVPVVVRTKREGSVSSEAAARVVAVRDDGDIGDLIAAVVEAATAGMVPEEVVLRDEVLESVPIGVSIADMDRPDLPLVYVNDYFEELTGYPAAEVLGRNCRFLQGAETAQEPVEAMAKAIDAGEPVAVELRNYRRDGTEFWNKVDLIPVTLPSGEVSHYLGFQRDVTEDNRREEGEARIRDHRRDVLGLVGTDEPPGKLLAEALSIGRDVLDVQGAYLGRVSHSDDELHVRETVGRTGLAADETVALSSTYSAEVVVQADSWGFTATSGGSAATAADSQASEIACYLGAPVYTDGGLYGTVSFVSEAPRAAQFSEADRTFAALVATVVGDLLAGAQRQDISEPAN